MKMFKGLALSALMAVAGLGLSSTEARADAAKRDGVLGCWKTIDDKTKTKKSIVKLYKKNGNLHGRIMALFRKPPQELNPKCDKCKGAKKNKQVIGMEIIWGLKANSYWWKNGKILDPANGKVYRAEIWLKGKGTNKKVLQVRGFVAFFYRTQTWYRTKCPAGLIIPGKKKAAKPASR